MPSDRSRGGVPETLILQCPELNSPEAFAEFTQALRALGQSTASAPALLRSDDPNDKAAAYLALAGRGPVADPEQLLRDLAPSTPSELLAAAAFCAVRGAMTNPETLRPLLFGSSPFEKSPVAEDARYFLVMFMGFTREATFLDVLHEALDHSHFCHPLQVAEALEQIGVPLDPETSHHARSISVTRGADQTVNIHDDERFGGSSNCRHCKFFPCRINRYFPAAIEDCKFWNKEEPQGEIRDWRSWGSHLETVADEDAVTTLAADWWQTDDDFLQTGELIAEGRHLEAIPVLCSLILRSERQYLPVAWVRLATCLEAGGEAKLAFLVMRDVLDFRGGFPRRYGEEYRTLLDFTDDPTATFGKDFARRHNSRRSASAVRYAKQNFHVAAFDHRVDEGLTGSETRAGTWFELGEGHATLGELALAELLMRRAAQKTGDPSLTRKFTDKAEVTLEMRRYQSDLGLDIDRRAEERQLTDPVRLLGPDGPRSEQSADHRAEGAYWLALTEENSIDVLADRAVARLRGEPQGFVLDIPADNHGSLFALLSNHAKDVFLDANPSAHRGTLKKMGIPEIVQQGLVERGLVAEAAALFAILHDELFHDVRFSREALGGKALALAHARFMTAYQLSLGDAASAGTLANIRAQAGGAVASLQDLAARGKLSPEGQSFLEAIREWLEDAF